MPLSSRFGRSSGGSFTSSIPETFTKKAPGQGATSSMAMFSLLAFLVLALKRYR